MFTLKLYNNWETNANKIIKIKRAYSLKMLHKPILNRAQIKDIKKIIETGTIVEKTNEYVIYVLEDKKNG